MIQDPISSIFDFNPRLREGGDLSALSIIKFGSDFNPRLREGGDIFESIQTLKRYISIHASAKEATNFQMFLISDLLYFNPRLREGGDIYNHFLFFSIGISIHASAKEATRQSVAYEYLCRFQSTPPRRRRRYT